MPELMVEEKDGKKRRVKWLDLKDWKDPDQLESKSEVEAKKTSRVADSTILEE